MPIFQMLSRLPAGVWLRAFLGLAIVVALAAVGLALFAAIAAGLGLVVLGYKVKNALFPASPGTAAPPPDDARTPARRVIDVDYEIVDKR
jgi:hypothetical protein